MLFPLGISLSFFRTPWVTLALSLILVGFHAFQKDERTAIDTDLAQAIQSTDLTPASISLFEDYCQTNGGADALCEKVAYIVHEGDLVQKIKHLAAIARYDDEQKEWVRRLVPRYQRALGSNSTELTELITYPLYETAKDDLKAKLQPIHANYRLYSPIHRSPASLYKAQFSHQGYLHLIGNLFFLIVFGAWVELRIGRLAYLTTYLAGGSLGLWTWTLFANGSYHHIVGASANVYAIMGAFFVLFFRFRMRFLVWFFVSRTFYAPVLWIVPLLYIGSEIVGITTTGIAGSTVAHSAHLGGMLVGCFAALGWRRLIPVPWPHINLEEKARTEALGTEKDMTAVVRNANWILHSNPENTEARFLAIRTLCKNYEPPPGYDYILHFLYTHFYACTAVLFRRKEYEKLFALMEHLPAGASPKLLFSRSGQRTLLTMGNVATDKEQWLIALRYYDAFLLKWPNSKKSAEVSRTLYQLIETMVQDPMKRSTLDDYLTEPHESAIDRNYVSQCVGKQQEPA